MDEAKRKMQKTNRTTQNLAWLVGQLGVACWATWRGLSGNLVWLVGQLGVAVFSTLHPSY
ncbi:MAG: hypothetical protein IJ020_04960 [Bacteroidaceae bacterium]|nr:hypothetical protein [Bacteroidaceae bacterium]